ncbi:MAG: hypothetical protein RSC76_08770, partial [Oscillospiraceae bacterium]
MRVVKTIAITLVTLFILAAGALALGGYWAYSKAVVNTMPEIQMESMESYATNIANALIKERTLEIPPEILSSLVSQKTGTEIACMATEDNKLKIWFRKEVQFVGESTICLTLNIDYFDPETGEISLHIEKLHVGELEIPAFLKKSLIKATADFSGEQVNLSGDKLRLIVDKFSMEI